MREGPAQEQAAVGPLGGGWVLGALATVGPLASLGALGVAGPEDADDRGELLRGRGAAHHPQERGGFGRAGHSGMFPCFFGGRVSLLLRSSRRARAISRRVDEGSITAST